MKTLERLRHEFRGYNYFEAAKRLVDRKPLQCSLYVTDRCNLDCAYCTEYDNSKPHPSTDDLKAWIRKIRDLGTMRIALVGGEPLLHPDIVEIVRYCREIGLATSLTTNGFLLSRELVDGLDEAGLQVIQISVDRMTPNPITKKSFKTILPKLDLFEGTSIQVHITGVLCGATLEDSREVLETGLDRGLPTEVRLVHADPGNRYRVDRGDVEAQRELLQWMIDAKARGVKIHTNDAILNYQLMLLDGEELEWKCTGGFKLFFVSAEGKFWECSMKHSDRHILDIQPEDLYANYRKKPCQKGCGVYCVVSTSLIYEQPVKVIGRELTARLKRMTAAPEPARVPQPAAK